MTASSADTAELPVVRAPAVAPVPSPAEMAALELAAHQSPAAFEPLTIEPPIAEPPVFEPLTIEPLVAGPAIAGRTADRPAPVEPLACRAELRNHRLQAARERRRYAAIGVAALTGVFGAAVAVLDAVH